MSDVIYDPESPSGLSRRGRRAGYLHGSGYWVVRINNVKHYAHRVVWELHNDPIPDGMQIDHIDGNKANNILENLRVVSPRENSRNLPMYKTNTTGVTCVFYRESRGNMYWVARWRENTGTKEKHFSCRKYGDKEARRLATECRDLKLKEEGAEYTDRHGRAA